MGVNVSEMTLEEALRILRNGSRASAQEHDNAVEFATAVLAALAGEPDANR